jgi:hypothetical protein
MLIGAWAVELVQVGVVPVATRLDGRVVLDSAKFVVPVRDNVPEKVGVGGLMVTLTATIVVPLAIPDV